jgi:hypothetical protein
LPEWISNGLLPLGLILLALWIYSRILRRLALPPGERRMAIFTLLLAAFAVLTVVGVLRGPGMTLP